MFHKAVVYVHVYLIIFRLKAAAHVSAEWMSSCLSVIVHCITLRSLTNGGTLINFSCFFRPPRSLLGPPFIEVQGMINGLEVFPKKRNFFFHYGDSVSFANRVCRDV